MATMLGFVMLVAVMSHVAPHLTRPEIFFGVTVAPDFRDGPVGLAVARRYAVKIWFMVLVAGALVVTSPMPFVSAPMLLGQAVGAFVAFVTAQRQVTRHAVAPATIREAELGPRPGLPGGFAAQLGPFLILLAAAAYVAWYWEDVPARFPTHWNLSGQPDGWTTKSVASVSSVLTIAFVICGMLSFTSYGALQWSRLPRVAGAVGEQHRRVRRVNLMATLATEYLVALLFAWTTVVSMFAESDQQQLPLALRVAPFVVVIAGAFMIRVMRRTAAHGHIGDGTPDTCWVFGRLYVNRADPALFVEKRFGLGYTLNLGNPMSWLVVMVWGLALSIPLVLLLREAD